MKFNIFGSVPSKKSNQIFVFRLKRLLPNAKYTQYQKDFGKQVTGKIIGSFAKDDKLRIHCAFFFADRITVRDIVNAEQSVWDCLQDFGVVHNDSQFYECSASKAIDKAMPRCEITIERIKQ